MKTNFRDAMSRLEPSFKTRSLTPFVRSVLCDKVTEQPFSQSSTAWQPGTWLCRQCGLALFRNVARFDAGCGWPAFNSAVSGAVSEVRDADGLRDEIVCGRCEGHLGHVFRGEGFTPENLRHCVNAASLDFVSDTEITDTKEVIVAAGCFWGVEYLFKQFLGVLKTEVGYTGGHTVSPTYHAVCQGNTGHYEAVRVLFDPTKCTYADLLRYFYEIHSPGQTDGQGPDRGPQYRSAIFFHDGQQQREAEAVTAQLKERGYDVATLILPTVPFWPAEAVHQDYYARQGGVPYCHLHTRKF